VDKGQEARLKAKTGIGKGVWFKDKMPPNESKLIGRVEDEVAICVGDYKHLIQRIRCSENRINRSGEKGCFWDGSKYGYRTGYYTFDQSGKKLLWGQYTQFLTEIEYRELLNKAKEKGWDIF
jgi:hypothetical protein